MLHETELLTDKEFVAKVDELTDEEYGELPFFVKMRYVRLLVSEANTKEEK